MSIHIEIVACLKAVPRVLYLPAMSSFPGLTPSEQLRFDQIKAALVAFEGSDNPGAKAQSFAALALLIPGLTLIEASHIWENESEDEFAWRHAIEKSELPGSEKEQQQIVELALSLRHFTSDEDIHLFDMLIKRHEDAFERLYGTPEGTFHAVLTAGAITVYDDFVIAMKRQGPIRL